VLSARSSARSQSGGAVVSAARADAHRGADRPRIDRRQTVALAPEITLGPFPDVSQRRITTASRLDYARISEHFRHSRPQSAKLRQSALLAGTGQMGPAVKSHRSLCLSTNLMDLRVGADTNRYGAAGWRTLLQGGAKAPRHPSTPRGLSVSANVAPRSRKRIQGLR
jgi:hypothetical protein